MENIEEERPETANPKKHDDMKCRHCAHVHKNKDGSCACGCAIAEV